MCRLTNDVCDGILPIIAVFVSHTYPLSIIGFHNLLCFSHSTSHSVSQWQSSFTLTQKQYFWFSLARNSIPSPLSCSTTQIGLPSIELARRFFASLLFGFTVTLRIVQCSRIFFHLLPLRNPSSKCGKKHQHQIQTYMPRTRHQEDH